MRGDDSFLTVRRGGSASAPPGRRVRSLLAGVLILVTAAGLAGQRPSTAAATNGRTSPPASASAETPTPGRVTGPAQTLVARVRDLGTLGGSASYGRAVSGPVVVGGSLIRGGRQRAFAYRLDAPRPRMRSLGTLGGANSHATDVSGSLVVGGADTGGAGHPFVYDLSATAPRMRDLGSFGGTDSTAHAVDGRLVVGVSSLGGDEAAHAFAYDLAAARPRLVDLGGTDSAAHAVDGRTAVGVASFDFPAFTNRASAVDLGAARPTMRDLGTLGGTQSAATAVSGSIVVGWADLPGDTARHAFAVDLRGATPAMRDLGTLGGRSSAATAVSGSIVVGTALRRDGAERAFAYDLGAPAPAMRDLGTLGGPDSRAMAVDGRVVAGTARSAADDDALHAFAYDLGAASPRMTDLGRYYRADYPMDVSGHVVAGSIPVRGRSHAGAWVLTRTTRPVLRLARFNTFVAESARRVTVTVTRTGPSGRTTTVRYATHGLGARAGRDFRARSGILRFAPGQVRRSFAVRIVDDAVREGQERIRVSLRAPGRGAVLGLPSAATLTIRASDPPPPTDGRGGTR